MQAESGATTASNSSVPAIARFELANGLEIVVIPDRRVPVATHMIWYRNGSADDMPGHSGIAHFLEHLMFKGTAAHPQGEFSELVADLGGQENAFTSYDYTAYFQRIAKEHLGKMMAYEADRMTGLELSDEIVAPERDVVLEERRMHYDVDPSAQLSEAVQATLFAHHPYGKPVIGWAHEIESLGRREAFVYYNRFYAPENAILVVAGDVVAEEVRELAEATYGKIPRRGERPRRSRPQEPDPTAARLVTLRDQKVEQPSWQRCWLVPSMRTAEPGVAEALEVLAQFLGGGSTGLFYQKLVVEKSLAVAAGTYYFGGALDRSRFVMFVVPSPGVTLESLGAAVDEIIDTLDEANVAAVAVERAKTRLIAEAAYAQDSQVALARMYGSSLAIGLSIEDVREWPERLEKVTVADVLLAARTWLQPKPAVTGHLLPKEGLAA